MRRLQQRARVAASSGHGGCRRKIAPHRPRVRTCMAAMARKPLKKMGGSPLGCTSCSRLTRQLLGLEPAMVECGLRWLHQAGRPRRALHLVPWNRRRAAAGAGAYGSSGRLHRKGG